MSDNHSVTAGATPRPSCSRLNILWRCIPAAVLALSLVPAAVRAQAPNWSFALLNPAQQGTPGTTLVYRGRITNLTGAELFLSGISLSFESTSPEAFAFDAAPEYLNLGGIIPSAGYQGPIAFVTLLPGASEGATGSGSITLFSDPPGDPADLSDGFTAAVGTAAAPEPGTLALTAVVLLFLPGFAVARRRRERDKRAGRREPRRPARGAPFRRVVW